MNDNSVIFGTACVLCVMLVTVAFPISSCQKEVVKVQSGMEQAIDPQTGEVIWVFSEKASKRN